MKTQAIHGKDTCKYITTGGSSFKYMRNTLKKKPTDRESTLK